MSTTDAGHRLKAHRLAQHVINEAGLDLKHPDAILVELVVDKLNEHADKAEHPAEAEHLRKAAKNVESLSH